jgi:hypothetical protein
MRPLRKLASDVWYDLDTAVNNSEPLFWVRGNVDRFEQVLNEAHLIFAFELRGLRFSGAQVRFFMKPADGLALPEIIKWIKQTFAVRFNGDDGRTGHIWGDRYGSEILPGEPPPEAEVYVFDATVCCTSRRARRVQRERGVMPRPLIRRSDAGVCPRRESAMGNTRLPPDSSRFAAPKPGNRR